MSQVLINHGVVMFKLKALKSALALEMGGFKSRGRSAYAIIKEQYGFRGSRKAVYDQFCQYIDQEAEKLKADDVKNI